MTSETQAAEAESAEPALQRGRAARRVAATIDAAAAAGLTRGSKSRRISGRAHESLVEAAAERSGLRGNALLEYALAKVALEDNFAESLLALEGRVGRELDLEP